MYHNPVLLHFHQRIVHALIPLLEQTVFVSLHSKACGKSDVKFIASHKACTQTNNTEYSVCLLPPTAVVNLIGSVCRPTDAPKRNLDHIHICFSYKSYLYRDLMIPRKWEVLTTYRLTHTVGMHTNIFVQRKQEFIPR